MRGLGPDQIQGTDQVVYVDERAHVRVGDEADPQAGSEDLAGTAISIRSSTGA